MKDFFLVDELTRVILPDIDGDLLSTYINANYIRVIISEHIQFFSY